MCTASPHTHQYTLHSGGQRHIYNVRGRPGPGRILGRGSAPESWGLGVLRLLCSQPPSSQCLISRMEGLWSRMARMILSMYCLSRKLISSCSLRASMSWRERESKVRGQAGGRGVGRASVPTKPALEPGHQSPVSHPGRGEGAEAQATPPERPGSLARWGGPDVCDVFDKGRECWPEAFIIRSDTQCPKTLRPPAASSRHPQSCRCPSPGRLLPCPWDVPLPAGWRLVPGSCGHSSRPGPAPGCVSPAQSKGVR